MKIIIVSGGFDPIHSGHINYINSAKDLGDYLVVALNSDDWLTKKKGKPFLPFHERKLILENLKSVNLVLGFEDDDHGSATNGILKVQKKFPDDQIIFCNGGDRGKGNIVEENIKGIEFKFGVGGNEKINSSSWIISNSKNFIEKKIWGEFEVFYEAKGVKLKKITLLPGKGISLQQHKYRDEYWFIAKGKCKLNYHKNNHEELEQIHLSKNESFIVKREEFHQLFNPYNEICEIIEIQYGDKTEEDDIKRISFYDPNNM